MINPCHRLVFKFSIWKNDVTFVNNTAHIAHALKAPMLNGCDCDHSGDFEFTDPDCDCGIKHPPIDPDRETLMRTMEMLRHNDMRQNHTIGRLVECIKELQDVVKSLIPKEDNPDDPGTDEPPIIVDPSEKPGDTSSVSAYKCNCSEEHDEISSQLDEIKMVLDGINDDAPIPSDSLKEIVDDAFTM